MLILKAGYIKNSTIILSIIEVVVGLPLMCLSSLFSSPKDEIALITGVVTMFATPAVTLFAGTLIELKLRDKAKVLALEIPNSLTMYTGADNFVRP